MASVLIIGGGVAGLAAAVELAAAGQQVTLCEQRSFCGGRAYAFREPQTGTIIDNGQHLFMGCYHATFAYLEKIGAGEGVAKSSRLIVPFRTVAGERMTLDCPAWPPPWHLVAGLGRMRGFPKRALWSLCVRMLRRVRGDADGLTVSALLDRWGQDAAARALFWTPLTLAICNEVPERAAATPLLRAMAEAFGANHGAAGLAFPTRDLSALLVAPALRFVRTHGTIVRSPMTIVALERSAERITGARLQSGEVLTADAYISAVPPKALHRFMAVGGSLPPAWERLDRWETVPICSVHLWFDRPVMPERDGPMIGLLGSRFQWVFDKTVASEAVDRRRSYCLALVISAAREEAGWPRERIIAEATAAVRQYLPASRGAKLLHAQVTKELEATVSLAPDVAAMRLPTETPWRNFFLAGDWTATGLPATIEGAIRSGNAAAAAIAQFG